MGLFDLFDKSGPSFMSRRESILEKTVKNVISEGGIEEGLQKTTEDTLRPINNLLGTNSSKTKERCSVQPSSTVKRGDILAVKRMGGAYYHFAVYLGNEKVIHYAAEGKDFGAKISIHEASYATFKGDSTDVFILEFPLNPNYKPTYIPAAHSNVMPNLPRPNVAEELFRLLRGLNYHIYSPEETVARAKSRLGEDKYMLPFNNCEHFAIWCKTGISESHQVNKILRMVLPLRVFEL